MKVSTRGRYALRLLLDVAAHQSDGPVSLRDVAARQDISKKYLEQIALKLTQADMLLAVRGHQGGYRLTRAPEQYAVSEVLLLMEGSIAPVTCLEGEHNACPKRGECLTLPLWEGLNRVVERYFASVTLRDILDGRMPDAGE